MDEFPRPRRGLLVVIALVVAVYRGDACIEDHPPDYGRRDVVIPADVAHAGADH